MNWEKGLNNNLEQVIFNQNDEVIITIHDKNISADLISAAPELLQGAKACVVMLSSYKDESSTFAASFLTKAIAKAEGGGK